MVTNSSRSTCCLGEPDAKLARVGLQVGSTRSLTPTVMEFNASRTPQETRARDNHLDGTVCLNTSTQASHGPTQQMLP